MVSILIHYYHEYLFYRNILYIIIIHITIWKIYSSDFLISKNICWNISEFQGVSRDDHSWTAWTKAVYRELLSSRSQTADGPSPLWHLLNSMLMNNPLTLAALFWCWIDQTGLFHPDHEIWSQKYSVIPLLWSGFESRVTETGGPSAVWWVGLVGQQ